MKTLLSSLLCLLAFTGWGANFRIFDLQTTNTVGGTEWMELDQGGIKSWKITTANLASPFVNAASNSLYTSMVANGLLTSNGCIAAIMTASNTLETATMNASNVLRNLLIANDTITSNGVMAELMTASNTLRSDYIAKDTTTSNGVMAELMTASNTLRADYISKDTITSNGVMGELMTASNTLQVAIAGNSNITVMIVTNLTVQQITVLSNMWVSNFYAYNAYATNFIVISNATIKGNTYISQTNFVNYFFATNLSVFGGNIEVAGTGYFNSIYVTNNSYFNGPALSFSGSASNNPAENELVTAHWVRGLFNNGLILYNSTNVFTQATNTDEARPLNAFTNTIPESARKHYPAVNLNDYIGSVTATNRFQFLQGPVLVHTFMEMTNGLGGPSVSVHPEFYYSYDGTNWQGDWVANNQSITTGTNLYEWVISFPAITSTNTTGFVIQRRFKIGAVAGATHPGVVIHTGTNFLSGTNDASHIAIGGVNSGAISSSVNFNELLSISNVWDGAFTNGVVDFGARKVVWNLTNGVSFTNFAGLELNTGTRALVLEMWLEGCTSAAPAVLFPTMGAASYSVRIYTNDYAPVLGLVTNATKQWLLWEAHGTNITLDARVYF